MNPGTARSLGAQPRCAAGPALWVALALIAAGACGCDRAAPVASPSPLPTPMPKDWRALAAARPWDPDLLDGLARVQGDAGRFDEAAATYRRALSLAPTESRAQWLGDCYLRQGKLTEAEQGYRQAVALAPNSPSAHGSLGCALYNQRRFPEAIVELDAAMALDPGYGAGPQLLKKCRQAMAGPEAAPLAAVEADPRDPEAWSRLGSSLGDQRRFQEAAVCFQQALKIRPAPGFALSLGGCALALGRFRDAEAACRQALAMDPRSAASHECLGVALAYQHRRQEALNEVDAALALDPANAPALKLERQLRLDR